MFPVISVFFKTGNKKMTTTTTTTEKICKTLYPETNKKPVMMMMMMRKEKKCYLSMKSFDKQTNETKKVTEKENTNICT